MKFSGICQQQRIQIEEFHRQFREMESSFQLVISLLRSLRVFLQSHFQERRQIDRDREVKFTRIYHRIML